jgi:hypothetical protein
VVAQFTAEGTNDGPLASLKPTGRKMSLAFCEICHFRQGWADGFGRLLLRSIHTVNSTRAYPTSRSRGIKPGCANTAHSKGALVRAFPIKPRMI